MRKQYYHFIQYFLLYLGSTPCAAKNEIVDHAIRAMGSIYPHMQLVFAGHFVMETQTTGAVSPEVQQ
jgi:hypothetical protein